MQGAALFVLIAAVWADEPELSVGGSPTSPEFATEHATEHATDPLWASHLELLADGRVIDGTGREMEVDEVVRVLHYDALGVRSARAHARVAATWMPVIVTGGLFVGTGAALELPILSPLACILGDCDVDLRAEDDPEGAAKRARATQERNRAFALAGLGSIALGAGGISIGLVGVIRAHRNLDTPGLVGDAGDLRRKIATYNERLSVLPEDPSED